MFFLYLGIAFVAVVLFFLLREDWPLLRHGRRTKGGVFDHRRTMDEGSWSYALMVRFTGENGEAIEITDGVYSPSPQPAIGAEVELVYPVGAPQKARVRRPLLRALIYVVIVFMLAILIARALGCLPEGSEQPAAL